MLHSLHQLCTAPLSCNMVPPCLDWPFDHESGSVFLLFDWPDPDQLCMTFLLPVFPQWLWRKALRNCSACFTPRIPGPHAFAPRVSRLLRTRLLRMCPRIRVRRKDPCGHIVLFFQQPHGFEFAARIPAATSYCFLWIAKPQGFLLRQWIRLYGRSILRLRRRLLRPWHRLSRWWLRPWLRLSRRLLRRRLRLLTRPWCLRSGPRCSSRYTTCTSGWSTFRIDLAIVGLKGFFPSEVLGCCGALGWQACKPSVSHTWRPVD